jgi:choline dehydrogenase
MNIYDLTPANLLPPPVGSALSPPSVKGTNPRGGTGVGVGVFLGLPALSPEGFEAIAKKYEAQDPAAFLANGTHPTIIEGYKQQQRIYAKAMHSNGVTFFKHLINGSPSSSPQNSRPVSRGTVLINPKDPESEPIVDYRAASNPIDLDILVEVVKFTRRYMLQGDLARYNATEVVPGAMYQTDDQIKEWVRGQVIPSVYHPIGTASKMPREWGGVVDEDLLVHGVKNLRVIDASIMPTIVGATTSMTVYAIAEKVRYNFIIS